MEAPRIHGYWGSFMLCRVASNVYWLNRYIERAENYSRFIEVNQQLTMDLEGEGSSQWMPLVYTTGDQEMFLNRYNSDSPENVIYFLAFDLENPNSIFSCLTKARENARTIRENISQVMWEILNEFYLEVKRIRKNFQEGYEFSVSNGDQFFDFFRLVRFNCQTFYGVTDSTISHDDVYHFAKIGRYLERADKTTRILDMKYFILQPNTKEVESTEDLIQWLSLLKSASAHEMYNRNYPRISPLTIAEFLIQNPEFPRSIYFCMEEVRRSVDLVSGFAPRDYAWDNPNRIVNQILKDLSLANMELVFQSGFHQYLDSLQIRFNEMGTAIHKRFFET